jgi:hypothetical protein
MLNLVLDKPRAEGLNLDSVVSSGLWSLMLEMCFISWVIPAQYLHTFGEPHFCIFAGSESRIADMREPRENIFKKETIFHGLEFLLTGFQSHKEKEVESVIRKFGGCVISKVPPCPFDKKTKLAELVRWKPPIVLSPKKVIYPISFLFFRYHLSFIMYPLSFSICRRNNERRLTFKIAHSFWPNRTCFWWVFVATGIDS